MMDILVWIFLLVAAFGLLIAIIYNKMSTNGGNFAATSVFADMQNEDKRNAIEYVIEEKAGNIKHEDENGEGK
jgi:hypothetical protein